MSTERVSFGNLWRSAIDQRRDQDPAFAAMLETAQGRAALDDALDEVVEEMATRVLATVLESRSETVEENRELRDSFEQTIREVWGEAIDLFELFVTICVELGDDFNRRLKDLPEREDDHSFEAVVRIHARSCLVAREVLTLVRSGYASGAHSRWRTVHELSVAACLVHESGDDLGLRYLEHDDIQRYKAALEMRKHAAALGETPPTDEEMDDLTARRDELCLRYGKEFANDYGWAAPVVRNGGLRFVDLQAAVGLDHLRPYFRIASHAVHAHSRGSFVDIGLYDDTILLAGPSDAGLANPAVSTCISLFDCTRQFLGEAPDLDEWLAIRTLDELLSIVVDGFHEAHEARELKTAAS